MIDGIGFTHTKFKFPCGETQIKVSTSLYGKASIVFNWEKKEEEILELLFVCDALRRLNKKLDKLFFNYFPYSRQDRLTVDNLGEAFTLKVMSELINNLKFDEVLVSDPHSDVLPGLLNNCTVLPQHDFFLQNLQPTSGYLVAPDAGAMKKIFPLSRKLGLPVISCSKHRDMITGEITQTSLNVAASDWNTLYGNDFYIVDDICDGGKTFIEIAKLLKDAGSDKIVLFVTHGFFTKGLEVFDGLIDEVWTAGGRVK